MTKEEKRFIKICKMTQPELKKDLHSWLINKYGKKNVVNEDGYLYAKGTEPVLMTAHMDTVHDVKPRVILHKDGIISSPQGIGGDDRCGIWMITEIINKTDHRPSILFCEDEEIGGIGSSKFCKSKYIDDLKEMKFLIELDRANKNDLVFYDDENEDFICWCENETGYRYNWGSFSDISHLCPKCGVSGVNISCGYYKAHTLEEYVVMEEMYESTRIALHLLEQADKVEQFEYIEYKYGKLSSQYSLWDDDYCEYTIHYYDNGNIIYETILEGSSECEALGQFFMDHPTLCFNDIIAVGQTA